MLRRLLTCICLLVLPANLAAQPSEEQPCYDAAVVARIIRAVPTEYPEYSDFIAMRWPWNVEIEADRVLLGKFPLGTRRVKAMLHNDLRPEIEHAILFLRRTAEGEYWLEHREFRVIEDRKGRLILPVHTPFGANELWPGSWMQTNYREWLRPIRYWPRDAWWLRRDFDRDLKGQEPDDMDPQWAFRARGHLVARRGFRVDDLPAMLGSSRLCPPGRTFEAPEPVGFAI